ncbi:MAG: hypothetical protein ACI865_002991 [Flavobacteriaceae bacterium]|jgi:hypothetical protein
MKLIYTFLLLLAIAPASSAQEVDEDEAEIFWEDNIQAILDLDKEKVMSQTNFPLSTFDGDWDSKAFESGFDLIFNEDLIAQLKYESVRSIQPVEYEPGEMTYMLVILSSTEIDGEQFESATMLSFKKYEGSWKLYRIDMAG